MRKNSLLAYSIQHKIHNKEKKDDFCFLMHKIIENEFEWNRFCVYDECELALSPI
jgi:hypothetical protein